MIFLVIPDLDALVCNLLFAALISFGILDILVSISADLALKYETHLVVLFVTYKIMYNKLNKNKS